MKIIKGITNYEMREKFDNIETILKDIKKKRETNFDISLFIIMTIIASIGTSFYTLFNSLVYGFFTIIAIVSMIFLIIKMYISKNKK